MISPKSLEPNWIEAKTAELRIADPGLLEVAIHAFELLCRLRRSDLDFVFKGGTSLLLHVPEIRRLSIDIDIVCQVPAAEFEAILDEIATQEPFRGWEEDQRGDDRLPKRRHYKVHFPTTRMREKTRSVIIDVVDEPCVIVDREEKLVDAPFLEIESETRVTVPTVNALLGDKLTAFAPHTVGVHPNDRYSLQVVKQMFDVGELFVVANDLASVERNYRAAQEAENTYRDESHSFETSLQDTIDTAFHFCQERLRGDPNAFPEDRKLLLLGVKQLQNHLVNHRFKPDAAKVSASRAAHLARRLQLGDLSAPVDDMRFHESKIGGLKGAMFPESHRVLQRLKATPEALYHWAEIVNALD